jgi:ERCC4-type nuclease
MSLKTTKSTKPVPKKNVIKDTVPNKRCVILIDYREKDKEIIFAFFDAQHPHIEYRVATLDVGDIHFVIEDTVKTEDTEESMPYMIIERKKAADLAASITDGRWREQKMRLLEMTQAGVLCMYLIEGIENITNKDLYGHVTKEIMYSSLYNTIIRDRLHVYHTGDTADTIETILNFQHTIEKQIIEGVSKNRTYSSIIKAPKKDSMTPQICYITQLKCIPRVSDGAANEIVKLYPTIKDLILAYGNISETNIKGREQMLANIVIPTTNSKDKDESKGRKLGPKLSASIYQFLYSAM